MFWLETLERRQTEKEKWEEERQAKLKKANRETEWWDGWIGKLAPYMRTRKRGFIAFICWKGAPFLQQVHLTFSIQLYIYIYSLSKTKLGPFIVWANYYFFSFSVYSHPLLVLFLLFLFQLLDIKYVIRLLKVCYLFQWCPIINSSICSRLSIPVG